MKLGSLSVKYKSNGDPGGMFCRMHQVLGNAGWAGSFIGWLQNREHYLGNILSHNPAGSGEFSPDCRSLERLNRSRIDAWEGLG